MDLEEEWNTRGARMLDLMVESSIDIVEAEMEMDDGLILDGSTRRGVSDEV